MRKDLVSKILVMIIAVLFIGVSCSSAISVDGKTSMGKNIHIDDDGFEENLVEFIVSTYGIGKTDDYTVLLTQEQIDELEMVINELNFRLKNSDSKVRTFSSLNWAFNNFKELNLFKNLNDIEILKLIIGIFLNLKSNTETEQLNYGGKENFNCVISGSFDRGLGFEFGDGQGPILKILEWIAFYTIILGFLIYLFILFPIWGYLMFYGKEYGGYIGIGEKEEGRDEWGYPVTNIYTVNCDIFSNGSNGIVNWTGEQFGQIRKIYYTWEDYYDQTWESWTYVGVDGFTGVKFTNFSEGKTYICGSANHVALDENMP